MKLNQLIELHEYLVAEVKTAYEDSKILNTHEVNKKQLNDIATFTDTYMEKRIVEAIRKKHPDHKFIGEEFGESQNESEYSWLIDPIDGTINFAAGIPMFGSSIALRKGKETIYGLMIDWPNDKVYYGIKDHGSFEGSRRLQVSAKKNLNDSILTMCITSNYDQQYLDEAVSLFSKLQPHLRGIRIIVCTVYELMWLASGLTDLMLNVKPSIGISSCAGKLIVQEAGGKVTNLQGLPRTEKDTLLVSNGLLHQEIVRLINEK